MKVDETIESVGKVWEQVTILIVLHIVFFGLAMVAGLASTSSLNAAFRDVRTPGSAKRLYDTENAFKRMGLDLPAVAGIACIVYLVTFQRLSMMVGRVPILRLKYSQPALWKNGKCFDELRQLVHHFEGYTASLALEDIEVTLGLAIAQNTKNYADHYSELVESPLAKAKTLSDYFSGFCLLAGCAIGWLLVTRPIEFRMCLLPLGLGIACLMARIGWERQIEYAVLGRLRFAIDCAVIVGEISRESSEAVEENGNVEFRKSTILSDAKLDNLLWSYFSWRSGDGFGIRNLDHWQSLSVLLRDLSLAAVLLSPASYRQRLRHVWVSHLLQIVIPWPPSAIPPVQNQSFRVWLFDTILRRVDYLKYLLTHAPLKNGSVGGQIDEFRSIEIERALADPESVVHKVDRPIDPDGMALDGALPPSSFRRWLKRGWKNGSPSVAGIPFDQPPEK